MTSIYDTDFLTRLTVKRLAELNKTRAKVRRCGCSSVPLSGLPQLQQNAPGLLSLRSNESAGPGIAGVGTLGHAHGVRAACAMLPPGWPPQVEALERRADALAEAALERRRAELLDALNVRVAALGPVLRDMSHHVAELKSYLQSV